MKATETTPIPDLIEVYELFIATGRNFRDAMNEFNTLLREQLELEWVPFGNHTITVLSNDYVISQIFYYTNEPARAQARYEQSKAASVLMIEAETKKVKA